jgi:hypothetical protein
MLFVPKSHNHRPVRVLTDHVVKRTLSRADLSWVDGGYRVRGRIIGWKRTVSGALGAIVAYPITGRRHLWGVNFADGRPRHLTALI